MVAIAVFTGIAGSGKTSLVHAYSEWLRKNFMNPGVVNLDPGAEELPYKAVFDIRRFFTIDEVMRRYQLGPNGAFVKASELVLETAEKIMSSEPFSNIEDYDMVLVDTPGQMEAFLFRPSTGIFFRRLASRGNIVLVYLIDASSIGNVMDAITVWFIYVLLQVKTGLVTVPVISKIDAALRPEIIQLLVENPEKLAVLVQSEGVGFGYEVIPSLVEIARKTKGPFRTVAVSARNRTGLEMLHALLHEAFCACGDLT